MTSPLERFTFADIQDLVEKGVLGSEYPPAERFWHWPVLQPENLPEEFKQQYNDTGEIRWYG